MEAKAGQIRYENGVWKYGNGIPMHNGGPFNQAASNKYTLSDGKYRVKYLFTSCRKFKGLEADAVILIDVDEMTFSNENVLIYYVGASRARLKLDIMTILSDDGCERVLKNVLHYDGRIRKAKKDFAGAMNAIGSISE